MHVAVEHPSPAAEFEAKTQVFLRRLLRLDDSVELQVEQDLFAQIGLDSIEAFDAIASLHELLDVAIPDTFNPKVANSIRGLSRYVLDTFGSDVARRFLAVDLDDPELFAARELP